MNVAMANSQAVTRNATAPPVAIGPGSGVCNRAATMMNDTVATASTTMSTNWPRPE